MTHIYVFWHICLIGQWKQIINQQWKVLTTSGLFEKCTNIIICALGKSVQNKIPDKLLTHPKVKLVFTSQDISLYEKPCLNALQAFSKKRKNAENSDLIFYFHTKGVTYNGKKKQNVDCWRRMMEFWLVESHELCIYLMTKFNLDTIGCNLINKGIAKNKICNEKHCWHYSGNFWWSHTKHIARLPTVKNIKIRKKTDSWLLERWILQALPSVKIAEIYNSEPGAHLYNYYWPRSKYEHLKIKTLRTVNSHLKYDNIYLNKSEKCTK